MIEAANSRQLAKILPHLDLDGIARAIFVTIDHRLRADVTYEPFLDIKLRREGLISGSRETCLEQTRALATEASDFGNEWINVFQTGRLANRGLI